MTIQAGKDPNKLKEEMMAEAAEAAATVEAAEAVKPEPTEPGAMPSAMPSAMRSSKSLKISCR